MKKLSRFIGGLTIATSFLTGPAVAATFDLVAAEYTKTLPLQDGANQVVTIWSLAEGTTCPAVTEWNGAPVLSIPVTDTALTINLINCLSEPVSLIAPALPKALSPVFVNDAQGRQRVRSMDLETAPGGTTVYTWNNVRPGTFLLHSGTMPGKQVPMGLYAAVTKDVAVGEAYPGVTYDAEVLLLYSEIDPALNNAVATGIYGTIDYPTSINYQPRYYLVNGNVDGTTTLAAAPANSSTLVRLLNAGLRSLTPAINGVHWELIAEDGNPYIYSKRQYSARLPAGKTLDTLFVTSTEGTYSVYDRRLSLTSDLNLPGGVFVDLSVGTQIDPPIANSDAYSIPEDGNLVVDITFDLDGVTPLTGVLVNDTDALLSPLTVPPASANLVSSVTSGNLTLNSDGSLSYTPNPDFNGTDSFTYRANDGVQNSNEAIVTLTVDPVPDAPIVADDSYETPVNTQLAVVVPGVLDNDTDVDGTGISVSNVDTTVTQGTVVVNLDGSFTYDPLPDFSGNDSFAYTAIGAGEGGLPGVESTTPATVTISVVAPINQPPVAVDDFASTIRNVTIGIDVLANDSDPDGTLDTSTVTIVDSPDQGGTVTVDPVTGLITYTPKKNFKGTEIFTYTVNDDIGATSNVATVEVNVTK